MAANIRFMIDRERNERQGRSGSERSPSLVVEVHDRTFGHLRAEEQRFRVEVRVHRAVRVQMVLRQVREDGAREVRALDPIEREALRRRFHRSAADPRVAHRRKEPLQIDRFRGRPCHRQNGVADVRLDGADYARRNTQRAEHRFEHERRRRLAVRSGHADERERARRVAEEQRRERAHRGAHRRDDGLRNRNVERPLDHERHGSCLDCARGEIVSVGVLARNAEEQRARSNGTRVVRDVVDRHAAVSLQARAANTIDQGLKDHGHGGRPSRPGPPPEPGGPLGRHAGRRELYHALRAASGSSISSAAPQASPRGTAMRSATAWASARRARASRRSRDHRAAVQSARSRGAPVSTA